MTKTLEANEEMYFTVKKKQSELSEKYKRYILTSDITSAAIKRGLEFVEDELKLNTNTTIYQIYIAYGNDEGKAELIASTSEQATSLLNNKKNKVQGYGGEIREINGKEYIGIDVEVTEDMGSITRIYYLLH